MKQITGFKSKKVFGLLLSLTVYNDKNNAIVSKVLFRILIGNTGLEDFHNKKKVFFFLKKKSNGCVRVLKNKSKITSITFL